MKSIKARVKRIEAERRTETGYVVVSVREGESKAQALTRKTDGRQADGRTVIWMYNAPDV